MHCTGGSYGPGSTTSFFIRRCLEIIRLKSLTPVICVHIVKLLYFFLKMFLMQKKMDSSLERGVVQITDNNRFWHVADHSIASNAPVKAKTTPVQWSYWKWNSKYVFGKTYSEENDTSSTYYIYASDKELKLTSDGGNPSPSATDKRVFERVYGANDIYTFKHLKSGLYAGMRNGKLELVEEENATHWELD